MKWPAVFPADDFIARFPEFGNEETYKRSSVQSAGQRAMVHIGPHVDGMPLEGNERMYALFLMSAHILYLDSMSGTGGGDSGGIDPAVSGIPFKASIGTVTVETTKPNSFTQDDWMYWLGKTKYGQELLALLSVYTPGVYLETCADSARDLV